MASKVGGHCLIYFGRKRIKEWVFDLPDDGLEPGMRFRVDLIDTWNMTVTPMEQTFTLEPLNRHKFVDRKR